MSFSNGLGELGKAKWD